MPDTYFVEALKAGKKEYRTCVAKEENPWLPVLEDILPKSKINTTVDLGVVNIPSEFIVGTRHAGRTKSFARNFMPIAEPNTEFAAKWCNLCAAHLEEGIRDPVKVYEYLNRYYVEEGNKRVSVLKFFDAVNIPAQVTRIMPERTPETEMYFELLEFSRYSKINFLEFSRPGSYAALQRFMGKAPQEVWTENERRSFTAGFTYFRNAYESKAGKQFSKAVCDSILACLQIYDFQTLRAMNGAELKKVVERVWEEMQLQQDQAPIQIKTDPGTPARQGILEYLRFPGSEKMKVAFLYDKNPETSGWALGHERGRAHVQEIYRGKIETVAYMDVMSGDPLKSVEKAIADGAQVLFTTSPRLLPASLRAAVDHPEVTMMNCSLNTSHRYIRTYYARMYEAKFIIGAMAGALTQIGRVGYICDYPIFGQIAGINAFALGVQMVNPQAKVYLEWSGVDSSDAAVCRLREKGMQLISSQDLDRLKRGEERTFGLSQITDAGKQLLVAPVWNWGYYYEEIIRQIMDKSLQREYKNSSKALNYYWGMSAGVVDLECADTLPESVWKMAQQLRAGICAGVIHPFLGPIRRQDGSLVEQNHQTMSIEHIINMDYLVENVVGRIPEYEELNEVGKATAEQMGIGPAQSRPKVKTAGGTKE